LSLILDQIGLRTTLIEGGYKAFRAAMLQDLDRIFELIQFRVVCGTTGSGKTRLLHALQRSGAQVLDLEGLASHRSSVLGAVPGHPQPTQKRFDTLLWDTVRKFKPTMPVYIECESKKVGNLSLPTKLVQLMRASPCMNVVLPWEQRIALLLEDYDYLVTNPDYFCSRLTILTEFRGKVVVESWKNQVRQGAFAEVFGELLKLHYDPGYLNSIGRNFSQFANAQEVRPTDRSAQAMDVAAQELLRGQNGS
jgi:tRNA 2-selenouridine synthase